MRGISHPVRIFLLLGLLLAACGPATTPPPAETLTEAPTETAIVPSPTLKMVTIAPTDTLAPPIDTPMPPTPTLTPTPSEPTVTQITIDGDPADWAGCEVLLTDPPDDHKGGGFDIAAVRAFANDKFLYVLVETHGQRQDYVQLDLEIEAGGRRFVVSFGPEEGSMAYMGEVTTGPFVPIGEVIGSVSAAGQAVEFKMPLAALEDTAGLTLLDVRPMAGVCCGEAWYAVDSIKPVSVARVNEVEPTSVVKEAPPVPRVCGDEIALPAPFGSLAPAPLQFAQPGYTAEWFVAPGAFNMPQEVFVTPGGDLLVYAVRGHTLFRVADDGTATPLAEEVDGYLGDVDAQGNLYLHFHPGGRVTRISPDGKATIVADAPELRTDCDSGFGIGPDGNMYLALNPCSNVATLYQITPAGQITRVADGIEQLQSLRTAPDGRFLAASENKVYELSLGDYSLTPLGRIPSSRGVSPGGLAADDAGNIYVSTGARSPGGEVYRLDTSGKVMLLANIPVNGLSGIEWLPKTGEIVGGQLRQGGLIAVKPDGTLREIVPGNGLVTPMALAFSPCGELAVNNDDGGMMALVNPAGKASWFLDYISFIPPVSFVAFAPDGTLYTSEAAPGLFPVRVAVMPPGEPLRTLISADMPSGVAYRADGTLFAAETGGGRVTQVNPDGSTAVLAEGLQYPGSLVIDADGNLYVTTGTGGFPPIEGQVPAQGDTILRLTPDGTVTTLARPGWVSALAVGPSGDLFSTVGGGVSRISPDGTVTHIANGLRHTMGLAFDLAGNLYVSDAALNGIVRIGGFPQGTLSGMVTDGSGAPVKGARVQVLSDQPIVVGQVMTTDANGRFSLPAAPRTYTVIVAAKGYETKTLDGIEVTADQETALEIEL